MRCHCSRIYLLEATITQTHTQVLFQILKSLKSIFQHHFHLPPPNQIAPWIYLSVVFLCQFLSANLLHLLLSSLNSSEDGDHILSSIRRISIPKNFPFIYLFYGGVFSEYLRFHLIQPTFHLYILQQTQTAD